MRYPMSVITAATMAALTACGGDSSPVEPPPDGPVVARIELVTDSALLFTGASYDGRTLVRAYDAAGHLLPDAHLDYDVPDGWTVRGDTIVAPAAESEGHIVITPARASVGRSLGVSAQVSDGDGASATMEVTAAVDLRAYNWMAWWSCSQRPGDDTQMTPDDPHIWYDSLDAGPMAVDSVVYPGDGSWIPNFGGVAQVWLTGEARLYRSDGKTDTVFASHQVTEIDRQAPDSLILREAGAVGTSGAAIKTDDVPLTYVGGAWCHGWSGTPGAVALVGEPKQ